jgi:hypothetical protein
MSTYAPAPAVYDLSDEIKESDATASEETLAHKIVIEADVALRLAVDGIYTSVITPMHVAIRCANKSSISIDCTNKKLTKRIKDLYRKYTPAGIKIRFVGVLQEAHCSLHQDKGEHVLHVIYDVN